MNRYAWLRFLDLTDILKQRTQDIELKKYAVEYMTKMGSFDYTRKVLAELLEEIKKEIERLGGNQVSRLVHPEHRFFFFPYCRRTC